MIQLLYLRSRLHPNSERESCRPTDITKTLHGLEIGKLGLLLVPSLDADEV